MSPEPLRFEDLIGLWQEGQRRLRDAEPADRAALERVVDAIVLELRRRLGGPFSVQELARLYIEQGTDWCFAIATAGRARQPGGVGRHDGRRRRAFARYAREASDYTVGRRIGEPTPTYRDAGA